MSFDSKNQILSIEFKKGQIRRYECSSDLAYGLFYQKNASAELEYYSNVIKKKCNVCNVTNPK